MYLSDQIKQSDPAPIPIWMCDYAVFIIYWIGSLFEWKLNEKGKDNDIIIIIQCCCFRRWLNNKLINWNNKLMPLNDNNKSKKRKDTMSKCLK